MLCLLVFLEFRFNAHYAATENPFLQGPVHTRAYLSILECTNSSSYQSELIREGDYQRACLLECVLIRECSSHQRRFSSKSILIGDFAYQKHAHQRQCSYKRACSSASMFIRESAHQRACSSESVLTKEQTHLHSHTVGATQYFVLFAVLC